MKISFLHIYAVGEQWTDQRCLFVVKMSPVKSEMRKSTQ